jgi:hypothetical protein
MKLIGMEICEIRNYMNYKATTVFWVATPCSLVPAQQATRKKANRLVGLHFHIFILEQHTGYVHQNR